LLRIGVSYEPFVLLFARASGALPGGGPLAPGV